MTTENKSWIVELECVVRKSVVCDGCTKEEAESNPFQHAVSEDEKGMRNWTVLSVEEND